MLFRGILILLLFSKFSFSNVIYDKNNITVTEIEIINYIELYKNNFGFNLNKNKSIKDIVLMKNTINFLLKKNLIFMNELDKSLKMEYGD